MPASPSISSLRSQQSNSNGNRRCQRHNSLTEFDRASFASNSSNGNNNSSMGGSLSQTLGRKPIAAANRDSNNTTANSMNSNSSRRRKYVTFTVELQRDGGPLGLTLATETDAGRPGPIFISALMQDGLAERTRTVQVNDQLVEVDGREVKNLCLNRVIPMLQESSGDVIK